MKDRCCPNTPNRSTQHSRDSAVTRRIASTLEYQRSRHERKKAERLFAHLKRILKLNRLPLRDFCCTGRVPARGPTRSHPRKLLSMAKLNSARSRVHLAS